jgi:hypothetical protein
VGGLHRAGDRLPRRVAVLIGSALTALPFIWGTVVAFAVVVLVAAPVAGRATTLVGGCHDKSVRVGDRARQRPAHCPVNERPAGLRAFLRLGLP